MRIETKLFEVRDSCTFIPVLATQIMSGSPEEGYLIRRAGYDNLPGTVVVTKLNECQSANEPHEWGNRTMWTAHAYIQDNFRSLETGSVIDVQFVLGERSSPKTSERLEGAH